MGVDFDSESGDTWTRMVRDHMRTGSPMHTRPPADRSEALIAGEVNRRLTRSYFGYTQTAEAGKDATEAVCDTCGAYRPLCELTVYDTWRLTGGVHSISVPRYKCRDHTGN